MDRASASEVARRLGTSVPRIRRAIDRLDLDAERGRGGRVRLDERQFEALRTELGLVPRIEGLSRVETQVLAALARAPRGLASRRAVARRAGVSPTAAGAAIRSLRARGLVSLRCEWVAAGRAREVELTFAEVTAPRWAELAPQLARVRLPAGRPRRRPTGVPARLLHLFWNAELSRLDVRTHGAYIAERLLSTGDLDGLGWGVRALRAADWQQAARNRGLPAETRALARNLARGSRQ